MHFLQKPSPALASTQWSTFENLILLQADKLKHFFIKGCPWLHKIFEHLSICIFSVVWHSFWWFSYIKCDFAFLNTVPFPLNKNPDSSAVNLPLQFPNGFLNFRSLWSKPLRKMSLSQFASKKRRRVTWVLHPFLHYFFSFFYIHTVCMQGSTF